MSESAETSQSTFNRRFEWLAAAVALLRRSLRDDATYCTQVNVGLVLTILVDGAFRSVLADELNRLYFTR